MNRRRLNAILCVAVLAVAGVGAVMTWAQFTPGHEKLFELLKEGAPLIIGVAAAILANAFQKRSAFIGFLRDEWYYIVETKTALMVFCRRPDKTMDDALDAWARISIAIDRMRIVYRNVGESDRLIGRYPYEPLHDMRRALEAAAGIGESDASSDVTRLVGRDETAAIRKADWRTAEQRVWTAFQALREVFLEELDLTEPDRPIVVPGAARRKETGVVAAAVKRADR